MSERAFQAKDPAYRSIQQNARHPNVFTSRVTVRKPVLRPILMSRVP